MTKTTKILTSTLLASSVIAFSAHASNDFVVEMKPFSKTTHKVVAAEVVKLSEPLTILDAGTVNQSLKLDAKKAALLKKSLEQAAPANAFEGAVAYEGKKWTVSGANVTEVTSHKIVTVPAESRRSNPFGVLDVLNADLQATISDRRSSVYADSAQQMADMVTLLNGLRAAYEGVYSNEGYIRTTTTKEDYWTAMKSVHDEMFPKIGASSHIRYPANSELKHVNPKKLTKFIALLKSRDLSGSVQPATEFTTLDKTALHNDLKAAFANGRYKLANTYKYGSTDRTINVNQAHVDAFADAKAVDYASRTVKTALTPAELKYAKNGKSSSVVDAGSELKSLEAQIFDAKLANSMSSAWTLYQSILSGKATYKSAAPLADSCVAETTATAAATTDENN